MRYLMVLAALMVASFACSASAGIFTAYDGYAYGYCKIDTSTAETDTDDWWVFVEKVAGDADIKAYSVSKLDVTGYWYVFADVDIDHSGANAHDAESISDAKHWLDNDSGTNETVTVQHTLSIKYHENPNIYDHSEISASSTHYSQTDGNYWRVDYFVDPDDGAIDYDVYKNSVWQEDGTATTTGSSPWLVDVEWVHTTTDVDDGEQFTAEAHASGDVDTRFDAEVHCQVRVTD
jgi:hypothetical protein